MSKYVISDVQAAMHRVWVFIKITCVPFGLGLFLVELNTGYGAANESLYMPLGNLNERFIVANYYSWLKPEYFFYAYIVVYAVLIVRLYLANVTYEIDIEEGTFLTPSVDMPTSLWGFIFLVPLFELFRNHKIDLAQIDGVYIDTQRWRTSRRVSSGTTASGKTRYRTKTTNHVRYNLSVVGKFGSNSLLFLSRQKRDEVRNALLQGMKAYSKTSFIADIEVGA